MANRSPALPACLQTNAGFTPPHLIGDAGPRAVCRLIEFFTTEITNDNTRLAYFRAVARFFHWADEHGLQFVQLEPAVIGIYRNQLSREVAVPTVKQHLAAIRTLFDWFTTGGIISSNPARTVRCPKYRVTVPKSPILSRHEVRTLLDSIDVTKIAGLRDRALIGVMLYAFGRVGAVVAMNAEDYCGHGRRWLFRLHVKEGRLHEMPAHHKARQYMDAYLDRANIRKQQGNPLFRTLDRRRRLTTNDVLEMTKRRARRAGLGHWYRLCTHSWRATGLSLYLANGGTLRKAQQMADHSSARTTQLYDRREEELTVQEIEKVRFDRLHVDVGGF